MSELLRQTVLNETMKAFPDGADKAGQAIQGADSVMADHDNHHEDREADPFQYQLDEVVAAATLQSFKQPE